MNKLVHYLRGYISVIRNFRMKTNVKVCPCHHGTARTRVEDGGDGLQIWKVAVNILNKRSQTASEGWSSSLGVGRGANKSLALQNHLITKCYIEPRN
jgi:hypothetical protein